MNIPPVFTFRRLRAFFATEPATPYDCALRDLAHGHAGRALAALDELLAVQTDDRHRAEITNKRGVALVVLHRRDEARAAFAQACTFVPEFAPALVNLGNLELDEERCEFAATFYERALRNDRDFAPAHRHLGLAFKRMGRTADAIACFSRARRLEGRVPKPQRNQG